MSEMKSASQIQRYTTIGTGGGTNENGGAEDLEA